MKHLLIALFFLPVMAESQVGNSYKNFVRSEFSDFFHISEIKRVPYKNGVQRELKMGGFLDYITFYVYTDTTTDIIHEATLVIDREWMDDDEYSDLSRDLVKSFLESFIVPVDEIKVRPAAELIFKRKTTKDKFALDASDIFNNKKSLFSQQFTKSSVSLQNDKQQERTFFRITIKDLLP
jgi:hypothetical protein